MSTFRYSAFISYSSKDGADFARRLHERLERDGERCFIDSDRNDLRPASSYPSALMDALLQSRRLVVVLTPGYCSSDWTSKELGVFFADTYAAAGRVVVLSVIPPLDGPALLRDIQAIDCRQEETYETTYQTIKEAIVGWLQSNRDGTWPPAPFGLSQPRLGARFFGRANDLRNLHERLLRNPASYVAVDGTPGVGKTQLAIEYAHLHAGDYPGGVFWVDAEQTPRIEAFKTIASWTEIVWQDGEKPEFQVQSFWRGMAARPRSLIVLDNFPEFVQDKPGDDTAFGPWMPPAGDIHVLVTTRRCPEEQHHFPLDVLDKEAGLLLLTNGSPPVNPIEYGAAQRLVEELGCLPLALEIIRAYVARHPQSFREYQGALGAPDIIEAVERMAQDYREPLPTGRSASFLAMFEKSYSMCTPVAQMVLSAMACVAPEPVPRDYLQHVVSAVAGITRGNAIEDPIGRAIDEIRDHSLIRWAADPPESTSQKRPVGHRLVLEFSWHKALQAEYRGIVTTAIQHCQQRMLRMLDKRDTEAVKFLQDFVAHAGAAQRRASTIGTYDLAFKLAICLSRYWFERGSYAEAASWAERAESASAEFTNDERKIAQIRSRLALAIATRHHRGSKKALKIFLEVNELANHAHVPAVLRAEVMSDLGMALRDTDRSSEALPILEEAVNLLPPGTDFEGTYVRGSVVLHLGEVLADLGRLVEGRIMIEQSVAIRCEILGRDHPETASSQRRLGKILRLLGRADEAIPMIRQALEVITTTNGPKHPYSIRGRGDLAMALRDAGQLEEARELLDAAMTAIEDLERSDHPTAARLLGYLALIEADLHNAQRSLALAERAFAVQSRASMSSDGSWLAFRHYDLAYALKESGRIREAEQHAVQALAMLNTRHQASQAAGAHPDGARLYELLSLIHAEQGKDAQAVEEAEAALIILEQRIGAQEPRTARARKFVVAIRQQVKARGQ